jgi:phenylpyruvate tautomerase PptA (4-oxalocrotonate tautomerase family)
MPYLRISSLSLDDDTKRHLADELTATILDVLPHEKPERTAVHFTPYAPGDFAVAGRLVADGAIPDTHLELSATGINEQAWHALRNRLTDVVVEALGIAPVDRWRVNLKLNEYDPHSFALAGNASDELDEAGGFPDAAAEQNGRGARCGSWRRPATLIGFALGALAAYRWLTARVGTDTIADIAEPDEDRHGEAVDAGEPDPRSIVSARDAREY